MKRDIHELADWLVDNSFMLEERKY